MNRPNPIVVVLVSFTLVACTATSGPPALTQVASAAPSVAPGDPSVIPDPAPIISPSPAVPAPILGPDPAVTSPTPSPSDTMLVRAYFFLSGPERSAGLVPVLREVPATGAVGRAAMHALLDGPHRLEREASPNISTFVPTGAELLDLEIEDGVATVDLSGDFETRGDSASQIGRLGQVVYTLTQFATVRSVAFRVDGRPVGVFGSEGIVLDRPIGRADLVDAEPFPSMLEGTLPAIFVDGPAWGATLGNPGRVTGTANTYEAWFMVGVYDAAGRGLNDVPSHATCGTGCRGTFDVTVPYVVSSPQWGTLRVLDGDESGATEGIIREYPVWLTPADPRGSQHSCGC